MRGRDLAGAVTITALVLGAGAYLAADAAGAVPGVLTNAPAYPQPSPFPTPSALTPSPVPAAGQAPATTAPVPAQAGLDALATSIFTGKNAPGFGKVAISVTDALSGKQLYAQSAGKEMTPASTTKLFTATAAIATLGPAAHATTSVVTGSGDDEIVLVGGGDVMLAAGKGDPSQVSGRAGLGDLAAATAKALAAQGTARVRLTLDDTLFSGPQIAPTWSSSYVPDGQVAPIAPIMVDTGKVKADSPVPRQADPALAAAKEFAAQLRALGIAITGGVTRGQAPAGAARIAAVDSAPYSEVAGYMLQHSDNTVAETLGRLVAHATGLPASFTGAVQGVKQAVAALGVDTAGVKISDCSGLSYTSKVRPGDLTQLLTAAYRDKDLRAVVAGMPIAALDGTLTRRFAQEDTSGAAGAVRAKTGTLNGVNALSGLAQDRDGRVLAFAAMINLGELKGPLTFSPETLLDRFAAGLVGCGCR